MRLLDLGYNSYKEYIESTYFEQLRKRVGVGKKKCALCKKREIRLVHHLRYDTLGEEKRSHIVGLCHHCNRKAHFYDDGIKIPVTNDGVHLRARWRKLNSPWYNLRHLRPSDILNKIIYELVRF